MGNLGTDGFSDVPKVSRAQDAKSIAELFFAEYFFYHIPAMLLFLALPDHVSWNSLTYLQIKDMIFKTVILTFSSLTSCRLSSMGLIRTSFARLQETMPAIYAAFGVVTCLYSPSLMCLNQCCMYFWTCFCYCMVWSGPPWSFGIHSGFSLV